MTRQSFLNKNRTHSYSILNIQGGQDLANRSNHKPPTLFSFRSISRDHPATVEPFNSNRRSRWLMKGVSKKEVAITKKAAIFAALTTILVTFHCLIVVAATEEENILIFQGATFTAILEDEPLKNVLEKVQKKPESGLELQNPNWTKRYPFNLRIYLSRKDSSESSGP